MCFYNQGEQDMTFWLPSSFFHLDIVIQKVMDKTSLMNTETIKVLAYGKNINCY